MTKDSIFFQGLIGTHYIYIYNIHIYIYICVCDETIQITIYEVFYFLIIELSEFLIPSGYKSSGESYILWLCCSLRLAFSFS